MKKIKKLIILFFCVYMAICQIHIRTYSYTLDEVKDIIDYKTVEDDGEPDKYDIEINAEDLKEEVEFPVIQADIDYVLYGESFFSSINFFGIQDIDSNMEIKYANSSKIAEKKESRDKLNKLVRNILKVAIYISAACLLTLLIYFAIVIAKGAISDEGIKMPGQNLYSNEKDYTKELRDKKFIEQWIKSVFMVTLVIAVLNIVISLSSLMSKGILNLRGKDNSKITIYVKADESNNAEGIPNLPDDIENIKAVDLLPMGKIAYDHTEDSQGKEAIEFIINTIGSIVNAAHSKYPMKKSLVIAQVINESGWVSIDKPIVRDFNNILGLNNWSDGALLAPGTTWYNKGQKTENAYMPHPGGSTWDPAKVFDNLYDCIEDYMGVVLWKHPELSGSNNLEDYRSFLAGYTEDPVYDRYNRMIQKYNLDRFDNMEDTKVGTKNSLQSCYFKTNLEGLFMFESQYKGILGVPHNAVYILCGFILTLFKWLIAIIFFIRMIILAILTIIAPIIIIIDSFKKINGNEGIISKWFVLYLFAVLFKPTLGALYYILTKIKVNLVGEHPFFIVIVIIVMFIVALFSLSKLSDYIFPNKD